MNYIEISFTFLDHRDFRDILAARLNEIEFESYLDIEDGLAAYIQESLLDQKKLDSVISDLKSLFIFDYSIKYIEQKNWNLKWEKSFHPVKINKDCIIRAHFHDKLDYKYEIIITPKMSFGTGHHETTYLMINQMFELDFKNRSVLDVGCGTGVLTILSKMLGSSYTLGIDIDRWSYENSLENAFLNNIKDIKFLQGDINNLDGKFDVIFANINRNIILSDINKYIDLMNQDADLLLSGFLLEDVQIIRKKSESLNLNFISNKNKNKWNLLHFTN